jgi:beta-aspartyl-peptidase (threonine type)
MRRALPFTLTACVLLAAFPSAIAAAQPPERPAWVLAVHGGAGSLPEGRTEAELEAYRESLRTALRRGGEVLEKGGTAVDAVERVVRGLEDDPLFNAGRGAVFTHEGTHELDAAIMDGATLACGAVAGVRRVKNPVSLARLVMETSRHVFLAGEGASAFADEMGVERPDEEYFFDQRRYDAWQKSLEKDTFWEEEKKGTVGCVALDRAGHLAAATSTGGITNKRFGRVGDVPVIGAGTYASDRTCAVSCTGHGETFIRYTVAHDVSALMEYGGLGLRAAADSVIFGKLPKGEGGLVALSRDGEVVFSFSTAGMFRGRADARGLLEVVIVRE